MKGLYLNVPGAEPAIAQLDELLGVETAVARAHHVAYPNIVVGYHPEAWPQGPIVDEPGLFGAASGWLVFRGKLGDLGGFVRAFAEARARGDERRVLSELEGAYVTVLCLGEETLVVTDPFGLHPHYFADEPWSQIAPSPHFLKEGRPSVPEHAAILRAENHLFGNLTLYRGIERLEPGAITTRRGVDRWFHYECERRDVREVRDLMRGGIAWFREAKSVLPLSGGLDSRLIALCGSFDYAYTFGPADTGDRPVARRFAGRFREYKEFSLLEIPYAAAVRNSASALFDGVCPRPFLELTAVYQHLNRAWGGGFFFDGYLGDVLQRGTYLTHGGLRGSLAKLLPSVTLHGFDPLGLLRRRHPTLSAESFALVANLFRKKTADLPLDDPHKAVLFEILYGRGARYTTNGGTVLSGQFWTPVHPFFFVSVFQRLFGQNLEDTVFYRTMRRVWSVLPRSDTEVPTYSGFNPLWNEHRARATMLLVKGMGKTGLYRRSVSFESELPRVRWV
jgi:hypothetical protein